VIRKYRLNFTYSIRRFYHSMAGVMDMKNSLQHIINCEWAWARSSWT
jgi:hypothetical protein